MDLAGMSPLCLAPSKASVVFQDGYYDRYEMKSGIEKIQRMKKKEVE